jgi:phosphatidylglycerol---prolipoprotein diacylglyceryl transferase
MLAQLFSFILWTASPEIIKIGDFVVRWYGLLFALGFLIGQQILIRIYKWEGKPERDVERITVYMVIATVVGARLGHVLFYDPVYYFNNPIEIPMIWKGGLASHGATIGILTAIWLYSRKTPGQSYLYVLDRLVITIALAGCLIRLGNLMNSEIIGVPTNAPSAFVFANDAETGIEDMFPGIVQDVSIEANGKDTTLYDDFRYMGLNLDIKLKEGAGLNKEQLAQDIINRVNEHSVFVENILLPSNLPFKIEQDRIILRGLGVPRHPSQLYEAIAAFFVFILLFAIYLKYKADLPEGRLFSLFVILIFGMRIIIEFLKEPQVAFEKEMTLNMGQLLSIPLVLAGLIVFIRSFRKKKSKN